MPGMSVMLFSLFFTLSAFAISANAVPPLISTLAAGFGIGASNFGFFMALQFGSFALASFAGGFVKERLRLGNHHIVTAGLIIIIAAFFAGTVLLRSALSLVLWIIPLGLAGGSVETFSSIEISALSAPGSSKNMCLSQAFYSAGAFAAPQLVYLCFGAGLGWKATFLLFGLFSAAVSLFFVSVSARQGRFRPQPQAAGPRAQEARRNTRVFAFLLVLMMVYVSLESLSAAWLSYIFEARYQLSARQAAVALMLFWTGMFLGRFCVVFLPTRWTLWPTLLASSLAITASALLLALADALAARYAGALLLGVFCGPMWPVIVMTTNVACGSERRTSTVIGMGAIGFGSGPLLGSLLLRAGQASRFFALQLVLGVLVLVLCLLAAASFRARGNRLVGGGRLAV
jgi:fucose permease